MSGDFESLLDRSGDEITEPKLYPTGTWTLRCVGTFTRRNDDGADEVSFIYVGTHPHEDVSQDELAEAGDDFDGNRLFKKFIIETKRDAYDVKRHLEMLGVDVSNRSLKEAIAEARHCEIVGYIDTRRYKDRHGEWKEANTLKSFAPVAA